MAAGQSVRGGTHRPDATGKTRSRPRPSCYRHLVIIGPANEACQRAALPYDGEPPVALKQILQITGRPDRLFGVSEDQIGVPLQHR